MTGAQYHVLPDARKGLIPALPFISHSSQVYVLTGNSGAFVTTDAPEACAPLQFSFRSCPSRFANLRAHGARE
ncbi:MAG TPA: hypothetical protein PL096_03475 [Micropepsaceae bacterium]|nr:hypothetical protein [Micropepsaceae bacterium]